ncbi:putative cytochrome P450 monooxygenase [Xylaria sp. CBS 124048]|nr:putative cytochrome P450 monooxygenase [Xylaria sp. CBS 124048]
MISTFELARAGLLISLSYCIGYCVYNVLFHPLRKYPGPLSHRMMAIPRAWYHIGGRLPHHVAELHQRYGPVVRIAPDELTFSTPQAWHDIYGPKKADRPELPKFPGFYSQFEDIPTSILNAGEHEHNLLRRQLAPGFSERAMHEQEPIIGAYVNKLILGLRSATEKNSRQNLREWYNWTTFDVIGDLGFGVDGGFGCLINEANDPWMDLVASMILQSCVLQAMCLYGLKWPILWLSRSGILAATKHLDIVARKVKQRMESADRPDFLQGLISNMKELGLTYEKVVNNADILVFAGSETTATLLTGATFFLTTNPEVLKKLEQEVRSAFKSENEITLTSVNSLSYMLACLNESLRCYPPVASGLPRQVPKGRGVFIDGHHVPEDTVVSVYQWAINHDEHFWTDPMDFIPDRWLGDAKYKNDRLDAMQSFSVGPRNCLGRNLAYAEMRLILAKIIYNFDMSLDNSSRDWMDDQKAFEIWVKPALNVHLKPVER